MSRIVCNFSCGAASAVATKLTIADHPEADIAIVNAFIVEEHPDNRRFLSDCEVWFGRAITVLRDERFGASTIQVFRKERYLSGLAGAPCSRALKRNILDPFRGPADTLVLGYTAEEGDRLERFLWGNNGVKVLTPLIDRGLTKADCLGIIERAGIALPAMYLMGYANANCIGCVKGGQGYWNKIRRDFPARFEEIASIQDLLGPGSYTFRNKATGTRFGLRQLDSAAGRYADEPSIACGVLCEAAETEFKQPLTVGSSKP